MRTALGLFTLWRWLRHRLSRRRTPTVMGRPNGASLLARGEPRPIP